MRKIVILDACVLYPAPLRDFLLYLAQQKLYKPRWSDPINDEWIRNVLKNRPDLSVSSFNRLRLMMNDAFPQANVSDFEHLLNTLHLPDGDDIHVLAAAAFMNHVEHLNNPPITIAEMLEKFRRIHLKSTADLLENLL